MKFEVHSGAIGYSPGGPATDTLPSKDLLGLASTLSLTAEGAKARRKSATRIHPQDSSRPDGGSCKTVSQRYARRPRDMLRFGTIMAVLAVSLFATPVSAALFIKRGNTPTFLLSPTPSTMNSESELTIDSIQRQVGPSPFEFQIGQCIQIQFYDDINYPNLETIIRSPSGTDTIATCNFDTGVNCKVFDDKTIELEITEATTAIKGTIGKLKNPYSLTTRTFKMRFYSTCGQKTSVETSQEIIMPLATSTIAMVFSVSNKVVADASYDNTATFKFKPATSMRYQNGQIKLESDPWYDSYSQAMFVWGESDFSCSSPQIQNIADQKEIAKFNTVTLAFDYHYLIEYSELVSSFDLVNGEMEINCRYWRNPLVPEIKTGFRVSTYDEQGTIMDLTDSFSQDATSYTPYQIPGSQVTYAVGNGLVQTNTDYTIALNTLPVYLENTGCYIKYTFPKELQVSSSDLNSYTASNLLLNVDNSANIGAVDVSLSGAVKYVVLKGCQANQYNKPADPYALFDNFAQTLTVQMTNIKNPYSQRQSSYFKIEVFKDIDGSNVLSNKILETRASDTFVPQSLYTLNSISEFSLSATNRVVQETTIHTFKFKTSSQIPSVAQDSDILTGFHIFFPDTIQKDPTNAQSSPVTIQGTPNSISTGGAPTFEIDTSRNYNEQCQIKLCYLIKYNNQVLTPPEQVLLAINNLLNPESVKTTGQIEVTSLMQYAGDTQYYKIDTFVGDSNFQSTKGDIPKGQIQLSSNKAVRLTSQQNLIYTLKFRPTHGAKQNSYIEIQLPSDFRFNSPSTTQAQFSVYIGSSQYASTIKVEENNMKILGLVTQDITAGVEYSVRIAGVQNPRYQILNAEQDTQYHWQVRTFDSSLDPGTMSNALDQHLIDEGIGGYVNIEQLSEIKTFGAEAYNQTNAAITNYNLNWFTEIETADGDILHISFPEELTLVNNNGAMECIGVTGVGEGAVECKVGADGSNEVEIKLNDVNQKTGLFKVQIKNVQNSASLRESSPFGEIRMTTSDYRPTSSFTTKAVTIKNVFASNLLNLDSDSITQGSNEYSEPTDYEVTFTPNTRTKKFYRSILLSYPVTVTIDDYPIQNGCQVIAGSYKSEPTDCTKVDKARLFKITKAIPPDYSGPVKIVIRFVNPEDNWGRVGVKVKTYEVDGTGKEYLSDILEGNQLIPILKCTSPCKECKDGAVGKMDKNFCVECWTQFPQKYLQETTPWDKAKGTGQATCQVSCDTTFSSNGTDPKICTKCDEKCETCVDNGNVNDAALCITCSEQYPFQYAAESKCMESCGRGYWQVGDQKCDICSKDCADCAGDKYNCTLCDYQAEANVLFTQKIELYNQEVSRGTCYKTCPNGFFTDESNPFDIRCGQCSSPCSTCEKASEKCLSCDGSEGRRYVFDYKCYEECPIRTAPDLSTLTCVNCGESCLRCGAQEGPSCYECERPFLLEEGECRKSCQVPGNRPNSDQTQCVGKTKFPTFGPIFTVISLIICAVVYIVYIFKRETWVRTSIIAFVSLVEPCAIMLNLAITIWDEQWKYSGFLALAAIVLILLNVYNWWYVKNRVLNKEATKRSKVPMQQAKDMMAAWDQRARKRRKKEHNSRYHLAEPPVERELDLPYNKDSNSRPGTSGQPAGRNHSRLHHGTQDADHYRSGPSLGGRGDDLPEGGDIEMRVFTDDSESERDYSSDEEDQYEGGLQKVRKELKWPLVQSSEDKYAHDPRKEGVEDEFMREHKLQHNGKGGYEKVTSIHDGGFERWAESNDRNRVYPTINVLGVIINFKFWRLAWSHFMGKSCFVLLVEKKKFKKKTVVLTLVSMFFVELPLIISGLVSLTELPFGEQLMYSQIDSMLVAALLIVFEFAELASFDKIIRSKNSAVHNARASKAALEDSEGDLSRSGTDSDDEEDDYGDWRLKLKEVEGNRDLFKETRPQLKINDLEKKFGEENRQCDSCPEFNTGWDDVDDPRLVESFPVTPDKYREFDGFDPRDYQQTFDNVYADEAKKKPTYSEMGMQTHPSEIMGALHRKGGDLLQPELDKDDYSKRKSKKKRGRKNKYIAAIDAEDDEEADQMSGEEDGLDGIQEEDDEDEEERNAKLEKLRELEEQAKAKAAAEAWENMLRKKLEIADLIAQARKGNKSALKSLEEKERQLKAQVTKGDADAQELLELIEEDKELKWKAKYGDPDAIRRLAEFDELQELRRKAIRGDPDAIAQLKRQEEDLKKKAKKDKNAQKQLDEIQRRIADQNQNGDRPSKDQVKYLEDMKALCGKAAIGDPDAEARLKQLLDQYRKKAKSGDAQAKKMLEQLENFEFDELRLAAYGGNQAAKQKLFKLRQELQAKAQKGDRDAIRKLDVLEDDDFYALRKRALQGDQQAQEDLDRLEEDYVRRVEANGDKNAQRRLQILADDQFSTLIQKGGAGDPEALRKLRRMLKDYRDRAAQGDVEAKRKMNIIEELLRKHPSPKSETDKGSELSKMMVQSQALQNFGKSDVVEAPPTIDSRKFNECDIIGNLERDEKGNVMTITDNGGDSIDADGKPTNQRGYLVDPKTGDIINNYNQKKMFDKADMDEKGEFPAPFNIEKYNFNPHAVRGDFDHDKNGKPKILKNKKGEYVDKRGAKVSSRGYRIDDGNHMIDNIGRKKFDKKQMTQEGDLPKLFNYNGRRFDVTDCIGIVDKDEAGNILPHTDKKGILRDNLGRRINSKGYLVDDFGNVIDKDGRVIFEQRHLLNDEIPKILPFTKFNIKTVQGDFEMDPLGNPILDKDKYGNLIDREGNRVNQKGYLIDKDGNVINKHGKVVFTKDLLDNEGDIPKVFRTGLLKSDTGSSLSRLMSEIGKNQPSEFDQEERRIQDELDKNMRRKKRGNSGNTSVDSMMEDTPANYNFQNQRFDPNKEGMEGVDDEEEEEDDEYGSEYDEVMGMTGGFSGAPGAHAEMAKKRRKKKKKKKKKKKAVEYEDPSLREHLLAGAYGGVAKPKPKRPGVKYTTDLNAGLRDIATPGSAFVRDASKKLMTSVTGLGGLGGQESSRGRQGFGDARNSNRIRSSAGRRSEFGGSVSVKRGHGASRQAQDAAAKLLDPQQREEALKAQEMHRLKMAKIAAKKKAIAARGGKISKDADFEKMFGKDIDEFLEDSEWDIESVDKMSQFSKHSKNTIRSAAQAGKLRGLEKLYLQRIESNQQKATLGAPGPVPVPGGSLAKPKSNKKQKPFRELQDRFHDDPAYLAKQVDEGQLLDESASRVSRRQDAWDAGSRVSRGSRSKKSRQ